MHIEVPLKQVDQRKPLRFYYRNTPWMEIVRDTDELYYGKICPASNHKKAEMLHLLQRNNKQTKAKTFFANCNLKNKTLTYDHIHVTYNHPGIQRTRKLLKLLEINGMKIVARGQS
jgi:hypothetical protein